MALLLSVWMSVEGIIIEVIIMIGPLASPHSMHPLMMNDRPQRDRLIYCNVHSVLYECAGVPTEFYMYILILTLALLAVYIVSTFVTLVWLTLRFGQLARFMTNYQVILRVLVPSTCPRRNLRRQQRKMVQLQMSSLCLGKSMKFTMTTPTSGSSLTS